MRNGLTTTTTTAAGPLTLGAVSLLVLTSCAPEEADPPEPEPEATETETVTEGPETEDPEEAEPEEADPAEEPDDDDAPEGGSEGGGEAPADRQGAEQVPDVELPVEPTEMHFSEEGAEVGLAGLEADETVEIYDYPETSAHIEDPPREAELIDEAGHLEAFTLAGREINLLDDPDVDVGHNSESTLWIEVEIGDGYGWIQPAGVYYFADTEDITEEYIDDVPPAEDPQTIAEGVAERSLGEDSQMTDDDGEPMGPDWTLISTPEDYDEEFYRLDVLGMMDDSVGGQRLFVTVEEAADGYELAQVESTQLCLRGVSEDGLCL